MALCHIHNVRAAGAAAPHGPPAPAEEGHPHKVVRPVAAPRVALHRVAARGVRARDLAPVVAAAPVRPDRHVAALAAGDPQDFRAAGAPPALHGLAVALLAVLEGGGGVARLEVGDGGGEAWGQRAW
jgi:hypothetical protein